MASHITTLSIFIILLAFFIALNAISHFNTQKATPVLESIQKTFGTTEKTTDLKPSIRKDPEQASGRGDLIRELEKLFRSRIKGVEAARIKGSDVLMIRLEKEDFIRAMKGQEDVRPSKEQNEVSEVSKVEDTPPEFMPSLVSMVRSGESGPQLHLKIYLNTGEKKLSGPALKDELEDIARITGQVEKAGIPARLLAGGVHKGPKDTLDLLFRPHQPFTIVLEEQTP